MYNWWIHQRCCQSKKIWHNFWWQHRHKVHHSVNCLCYLHVFSWRSYDQRMIIKAFCFDLPRIKTRINKELHLHYFGGPTNFLMLLSLPQWKIDKKNCFYSIMSNKHKQKDYFSLCISIILNLNCCYSILANTRKQKDCFLWKNMNQSMSRNWENSSSMLQSPQKTFIFYWIVINLSLWYLFFIAGW